MKKSRVCAWLLFSLLPVFLVACGGVYDEGIAEAGKIVEQTYTNEKLHFSYTFPESWRLFNAKETLENQEAKAKAVFGSSEDFKQTLQQGHMEYPLYAEIENGGTYPANFLIQTAPAQSMKGMSVQDYAQSLAEQFTKQYQDYGGEATVEPVEAIQVNGREVAVAAGRVVMNGEVNGIQFDNYTAYQTYTIFKENNSIVISILTAFDDSQLAEGTAIFDSLAFIE